jgi:chromosome segregation protein
LTQLEQKLGEAKQERDRAEQHLRERHLQQQQQSWQLQKLQETQLARREELTTLQAQLQIQQAELPDPLPEVPVLVNPQSPTSDLSELNPLHLTHSPLNSNSCKKKYGMVRNAFRQWNPLICWR